MKRNQLNQNGYRIGVAGGRPGFTLVEMLTVIVIIGILAALISAATIYARARAREAAIYVQIKQMEAALMEYKNQFGEFPPDFWGLHSSDPVVVTQAKQEVLRHLRRRWPRYQLRITVEPTDTPDKIIDKQFKAFADDVRALGIDPERFDAATALVFWLGGLPAEP
ncbi:MAG TPA: prepilin-type N-terminal cleavage/methylation domain-containing protein, partial [Thermogutta sp.]|nr:prepilin-type N-terminal cleavage/methylation domain-containing protein [Thermogutta sp.]